jgi:hypothetical protein
MTHPPMGKRQRHHCHRAGRINTAVAVAALLVPSTAVADDPMLLIDRDGFMLRAHLQAGINAVAEQNLFWNYADIFAPGADFDADTDWLEGYLMPGLSFTQEIGAGLAIYGKISAVASGTIGIDAFAVGNTGRLTLEEGYLGIRSEDDGSDPAFDLSLGPREFKAGTGMLIANGGTSGFERGALKLGPRKAWEDAALARFDAGPVSATAFYLDANELKRNDSSTRIVGGDIRYDGESETYAGLTFGYVPQSNAPYPKAAPDGIGVPAILPGARDGLTFVNLYGRANPFDNVFVAGDFAYEWNDAIDMQAYAFRIQAGYTFAELSWTPTLAYGYQSFSGDDPSTSKLERFDPLYFEGSPSAWSTGSKSSMVFINSNVNAHQVSLSVRPTERDTLTLRYARVSANELKSPIQFGQGTRIELANGVPNPVAGVTKKHLTDDIYLEYNRVVNANTYLTAGFSVSFPGAGLDSMIGKKAPTWTGGFINVVVNF